MSCCTRRSSLHTGVLSEVVFAGMPLTQLEAASLMHPFAADVALALAAVSAELAVAVLLVLVAVLGAASMLVLFEVLLAVPTLLLPLESCLGNMRRPMKVADVAVLCGVLPLLVVEAFRAGSPGPPFAAFIASMIADDDLTSSVSVRVWGYDRAQRHEIVTYQVTLRYVPGCTCVPCCGDMKIFALASVAASATEMRNERSRGTVIMLVVRWRMSGR